MAEKDNKMINTQFWGAPPMGDVFSDRLHGDFANMKGQEVSEEEYKEWLKKEGFTK